MKNDINATLNKLIAYARDHLMLDSLDEVYTLNRLATLAGVKAPKLTDEDSGDDFGALIAELKAAAPGVDASTVADILMPAPHTVDYYFGDELGRNPKKAFDFLYELFECCGSVNASPASTADGYTYYADSAPAVLRAVMLDVDGPVPYTPLASGARVAALDCDDILSNDMTARLMAYVASYGGAIAHRQGTDGYLCCASAALTAAKAKTVVKDGPVKVALLDYPVPAVSFSGIAKNAVAREAARVIKAAADAGIAVVAAAAEVSGAPVLYAVFANNAESDIITGADALTACGVFRTVDFAPLLPVLEKGTALSSDLFAFKSLYSGIGGVKHGAKAKAVLDAAVIKQLKTALAAAASADEAKVTELINSAE